MDQKQQSNYVNTLPSTHIPAHLWIGSPTSTVRYTKLFLQKTLCLYHGCGTCSTCIQIDTQQHHALMWLNPEKQYTLEQLYPVFATITFTLDEGEQYFFIIQKADFLSPLCANRLLKSLEEPPAGYSFILLAQNKDAILPTIRSRCLIKTLNSETKEIKHQKLFNCLAVHKTNPLSFWQALEESTINERESVDLLNTLLNFWTEQTKQNIFNNNEKEQYINEHAVALLRHAFDHLPMPGSSKLFWRTIFLQIQEIA